MRTDERIASLVEDLRALAEPDERDRRLHAELGELLRARASAGAGRPTEGQPTGGKPTETQPRRARRPWRRFGTLAAPAAAIGVLALALSVLVAGHRGASAAALLRQAAAVTFGPNQARHLVYDVTMTLSGRVAHGTAEIWIATDGAGKPVQATETLRLAKVSTAPTAVIERDAQTPSGTYTYDGTHDAIVIPSRNDPSWSTSKADTLPLPLDLFEGTTVARRLAELSAQGAAHVRLLSPQTLDGVSVDVVQVDGWPRGDAVSTTLYFDRGTHLLRGFDSQGTDPSYSSPVWRVRLARQASSRRAVAPADAFTLNAPAFAQVSPPPPDLLALARLCANQPKRLLFTGQGLLSACRASNPAVTRAALVTALVGTAPQDLAAAVAAHAINQSQARAALRAQRVQIVTALTSGHRPLTKLPAAPGK